MSFRAFLLALNLLSALVFGSPVISGKDDLVEILNAHENFNDGSIVAAFVDELKSLSSSNKTKCEQCVTRLAIGKSLSLLKPNLVPKVFTKWCTETGYMSNKTCIATFSRNTVESSNTGTNFADMLSLMDPFGYDGQLYCNYKESGACPKPLTPNVSLSHMWPEKQPKHSIAPEPSNETFNVLHVSDFHIELDYTVGAEANCSASMCCTPHSKNSVSNNNTDQHKWNSYYNSSYTDDSFSKGSLIDVFQNSSVWAPATTFGNYKCDAPEILINSSLDSIAQFSKDNDINFDFAIFTGDLVDHDEISLTSYEMTVQSEEIVFRDIKKKLADVPVYSVMGNHDTFPYGELAQENHGFANLFSWNAELMADLWEDYGWLGPSESQYARKHYTGFSVVTKKGLKVIALNSNVWYKKNHYAYWNASEPDTFGQFQFLIDELVESESKDQRVWILAHIPFSSDVLPLPSKLFAEVVQRFSPYTVANIFFGHTHLDQFEILYSTSGEDAKTIENVVASSWISQAVTPWVNNNPSWRYYTVDEKTFSIMNAYNFYTKLNETFTNDGAEPVWEFEYSSREGYNITWPETSPLNATYWHKVASAINNSVEANQLYRNYAMRFSPYVPDCAKSTGCADDYCYLTSFTVDEYDACVGSSS
ncbi:KLTH0E00638p [Lachancea thermotolerans CBS 6340]|uniref:KLTH0E00638p n=1 Tax=Lachancea thermotolerans (strain ATCC 56472 / CBS 6340 / NRRL Y-8284) TaxID=559295 RepID=C5DH17_LACTC|nr:KLTH0E00638p [Lachancea thermotolerans CBS 6340]CAR23078.1 KLTH0E00638p [Lachancea thermotolerans CBS 6340]